MARRLHDLILQGEEAMFSRPRVFLAAATVAAICGCAPLRAQNIGWEGETGVFVTPLAYTAASPSGNFGKPLVAFHYLDGGAVLGDFFEVSATEGALGRTEF